MADREVADLLAPLGTLLAAFAFFFQSVKDRIEGARLAPHEIETQALTVADLVERIPRIRAARNVSLLLALASTGIAASFVTALVDVVRDPLPDGRYSPVRAAFFFLEVFWVGVSAGMWVLVTRLSRDVGQAEREVAAQERALASADAQPR